MKSIGKHNGVWHWFQRCGQIIFCISLSLSQHLIRFTGNHKSSNLWTYTMTPQKHRTHTLVKQVTSSKFLISFNSYVQLFCCYKTRHNLKVMSRLYCHVRITSFIQRFFLISFTYTIQWPVNDNAGLCNVKYEIHSFINLCFIKKRRTKV